jgi:hypothetical protein
MPKGNLFFVEKNAREIIKNHSNGNAREYKHRLQRIPQTIE